MSRDLIERLRARAAGIRQLRRQTPADIRDAELDEEAAAALEAEAYEGERRAEAAARDIWDDATNAVCQTMQRLRMCRCKAGKCLAATLNISAVDTANHRRALIPEAPARANPEDDPRYPALLADAKARVRNENLDGSPRRHAVAKEGE